MKDLRLESILLVAILLLIAGLRIWFDLATPPMGDEAYYWMWGQKLGWSYFDHPPLDAWLQAIIAAIFGWSRFSLRLLTWISLFGTFLVLVLWERDLRQAGDAPNWAIKTGVILMTVPVIALFGMPAFHDHLLVFFVVASIYCFWRYVVAWELARRGVASLYLAAALLGLATLSKYNGALLGPGLAVVFLLRPKLRGALRTPHPYLAAALAVLLQAPVIYWNLTEGFATLRFHFVERPSGHWTQPDIAQAAHFLLLGILAAGPFLLFGSTRLRWVVKGQSDEALATIVLAVFGVSTAALFVVSLFTDVLLHWNIVAYTALALAGVWALGRWLVWPHVLITLYLLVAAIMNYTSPPGMLPGFSDPGAEANFGWPEVAEAMRAAQTAHPGAFLAATKYNYAAQLSFELHDLDVTAINPLRSQYDLWWTPADHLGQDAIIVADSRNPIALSSDRFRSILKLAQVPVLMDGRQIWAFEIYLGQGYQMEPPNPS